MITYIWTITGMSTVPKVDNKLDVVVLAQWVVTGADALGVQARTGGVSEFTLTQGAGYIPYDELTEAQVIIWVQDGLGVAGIANVESSIQNQITSTLSPIVIPTQQPLPWAV